MGNSALIVWRTLTLRGGAKVDLYNICSAYLGLDPSGHPSPSEVSNWGNIVSKAKASGLEFCSSEVRDLLHAEAKKIEVTDEWLRKRPDNQGHDWPEIVTSPEEGGAARCHIFDFEAGKEVRIRSFDQSADRRHRSFYWFVLSKPHQQT